MGSISLPTTVDASEELDLIKLPLFEPEIAKTVHLLKQLDYNRLFNKIYQSYVKKDFGSVPGGYKTVIRASCVVLRAFSDGEMEKLNIDATEVW